jgi:hypothetical protein
MLGQLLYNAGWDQGVLLPALPWSVHFHLDDPLTGIAKSAQRQAEAEYQQAMAGGTNNHPRRGLAQGKTREKDWLVVISQTCDIVKSPDVEPTVVAMRAFITDKENILGPARGNSSRYFLLDPNRGLVADATVLVQIEKPLLMQYCPEPGVIDVNTKDRFAQWLAYRFSRPAIDDNVVGAVVKPILTNLRQMQQARDLDFAALEMCKEVRLARITGAPPYDVRLLFIIPESGLPDKGIALARLVNRMSNWFDPGAARLVAWDALDLYQISVGDFLNTQKIYLDEYNCY